MNKTTQTISCILLCCFLFLVSCSSGISSSDISSDSLSLVASQESMLQTTVNNPSGLSSESPPAFSEPASPSESDNVKDNPSATSLSSYPFLSQNEDSHPVADVLFETSFHEPIYSFMIEDHIWTGVSTNHLFHFDLSTDTCMDTIDLPYQGITVNNDYCFSPRHRMLFYNKNLSRDVYSEVVCMNSQSGTVNYVIPRIYCEDFYFSNDYIYLQMSSANRLTCYNIHTGKKLWEAPFGFLTTAALRSPSVEVNNRCYTVYWGPADMFCLAVQNPATGDILQTVELGKILTEITYPIKSLYTYGQYLLVYGHMQGNTLQMFRVDTNPVTPLWQRSDIPILYSQTGSVQVDSTGMYVLSEERKPGQDVLREDSDFYLYKLHQETGDTIHKKTITRKGFIPVEIVEQGFFPWNGKPRQDKETKNLLIRYWSADFQTNLWCAYDRDTLEKQWEWAVDARYSKAICLDDWWILSREEKESTEVQYYFVNPDTGAIVAQWTTTVGTDPSFKIADEPAHFFQDTDKNIWMVETESGDLHKLKVSNTAEDE